MFLRLFELSRVHITVTNSGWTGCHSNCSCVVGKTLTVVIVDVVSARMSHVVGGIVMGICCCSGCGCFVNDFNDDDYGCCVSDVFVSKPVTALSSTGYAGGL